MKLRPLLDKVVIKKEEAVESTKSGIVLPGSAQEKPQVSVVVAVGPGGVVDGKEIVMTLKEGDRVIVGKYSGTEVKTDDDFEDDEVDYSDEAYEQDSDARAQMTDKEIINHLWENGDFNDYNSMISDSSYDPEEGYFTDDDELSDMADQFMEDHGIEYSDDAWNAIRNKFMAQAEKIFKSTKQIDIHAPSVKNMGF